MITSNIARVLLTCGAVLVGVGCSAGAPGTEGNPELTRAGQTGLSGADFAGLYTCAVTESTYADCIVDPAFPVYTEYSIAVTPDDGSKGFTFIAKTEITGPATSVGTPVRLRGDGWKAVWSWEPATAAPQAKSTLTTETFVPGLRYVCKWGSCYYTVVPDKGPGSRLF